MTLRRRLLRSSMLTLAVGLGALLVCANVLLAVRARAETSTVLRARAEAQLATLTVTRDRVVVRESPNDAVLDRQAWVFERGRVLERPAAVPPALDRAAVALGRSGGVHERDAGDDMRLRVVPAAVPGARAPTGAVVVGVSVASVERLQKAVLLGSLVLAALVLVAGALAMRGAIDGALRPVARMTADAEGWSEHDLDGRFALGPPRDELTGLAATLDRLLARIAASRRHEQRFASEVAHELRTPLASILGHAELALAAPDRDASEALAAIAAGATRLRATIDTLLAVSRRDLDPSAGTVDLAALAAEVEDVDVVLGGTLSLAEGDEDVVRRALSPLVDNARRHARGRVWLELHEGPGEVRLVVRDDGPGLDPVLGDRAFDPGTSASGAQHDGAGLGLPLARRLARSCGGDVVAEPGPGGAFALRLPALGSQAAVRREGAESHA